MREIQRETLGIISDSLIKSFGPMGSTTAIVKNIDKNGVNINIEYMYAFITVSKKYASVVLRVADNEAAEKILVENGVKLLEEKDIADM